MEKLTVGSMLKNMEFVCPVVNNVDPLKLQRIRVRIPILHDGVPDNLLPWCAPSKVSPLGQGGGAGSCAVPVQNSLVRVTFKDGDPHQPEYTGTLVTPTTVNPLFSTNYPNRYGLVDPKGNHLYVDMTSGDIEVLHFSGTKVHINPDGSATIHFAGNVTSDAPNWNHTGPVTINGTLNVL